MTISLRLNSELERIIEKFAESEGKTKSELIRNLIIDFVKKKSVKKTPWEVGKNLFGKEGSSLGNLSIDRKRILKDKLHVKKSRY